MARSFSGQLLRDERVSAGLTPEHLALAVQRSSYSVREWEWGRVTPPVPVLARLADLLNCPVDRFFEETADVAA